MIYVNQYIFILGREKEISSAELCSILGGKNLTFLDHLNIAIYESNDLSEDLINKLGGTIKIAKIEKVINSSNIESAKEYIKETIQKNHLERTKINFGISVYGVNVNYQKINKLGFEIKKELKTKFNLRFIQSKNVELNAATIINNKLVKSNNYEIILISNNKELLVAKTLQIQNINDYAKRDFNRPYRDSKVGMLPPKLAQIIINLALFKSKNQKDLTILDPFCGTGVILQEAKLMGFNTIGSDIDQRMVEYTKNNLIWLDTWLKTTKQTSHQIIQGDSRNLTWPKFNLIASEIFLGSPLPINPSLNQVEEVKSEITLLLKQFLLNLYHQIDKSVKISLAIPVWNIKNNTLIFIPIIDQLKNLGYNLISFDKIDPKDLVYIRPGQVVGRQLILLEKE